MNDVTLLQSFEEWWDQHPVKDRSPASRERARKAFLAGCRAASKDRSYRFQSGRWVVTVLAPTKEIAKQEAIRKLDHRAAKLGAETPSGGWRLIQVRAEV